MIDKFLKRSSWTDIIISLVFAFFGLLLIIKPEATMEAITIVLGTIFIAMGILKLAEYFTREVKEDYLLTIAIVEAIIGVIMIFASETILSAIKIILGIWIILNGIMDLQISLEWNQIKSPYCAATIVFSILMITAGIVILTSESLVLKVIGIITVAYAVLDIIDKVIFMKKIDNFMKE